MLKLFSDGPLYHNQRVLIWSLIQKSQEDTVKEHRLENVLQFNYKKIFQMTCKDIGSERVV